MYDSLAGFTERAKCIRDLYCHDITGNSGYLEWDNGIMGVNIYTSLRKHAHALCSDLNRLQKCLFLDEKTKQNVFFFLFFAQNIYCRYTLE